MPKAFDKDSMSSPSKREHFKREENRLDDILDTVSRIEGSISSKKHSEVRIIEVEKPIVTEKVVQVEKEIIVERPKTVYVDKPIITEKVVTVEKDSTGNLGLLIKIAIVLGSTSVFLQIINLVRS